MEVLKIRWKAYKAALSALGLIMAMVLIIACSTVKWQNRPQYFVVDAIINDTIYRVSIHDEEWITRIYYAEKDSVWALGDTLILQRK